MTNYMLANLTKTSHIGEPDAVKVASPVRRGAVGKVSVMITRWLPTLHLYHLPNVWVTYDAGARQFTDEAKAKLEGVVASHYQRSLDEVVVESGPTQAEDGGKMTEQEEASENVVPPKLRKQFETLGGELYGERWAEVSRHNAARLTENQTDDPNALTVEQMQKLINGMKQLKRQRRTAKPHTKESTGGDREEPYNAVRF